MNVEKTRRLAASKGHQGNRWRPGQKFPRRNGWCKHSAVPSNVYCAQVRMPIYTRRVAVLPTTAETADWKPAGGCNQMEPLLQAELGKLKAFDAVHVPSAQLQAWT